MAFTLLQASSADFQSFNNIPQAMTFLCFHLRNLSNSPPIMLGFLIEAIVKYISFDNHNIGDDFINEQPITDK